MLLWLASSLAGCASSVGPSRHSVETASSTPALSGFRTVEITDEVAQQLARHEKKGDFALNMGDAAPVGTRVGVGDTLEVTIWEAAPAALFGSAVGIDPASTGTNLQTSRPNSLPGIMVGPSGFITIPFAGQVPAAGRTLREIEADIVKRLRGRAHLPQVIVRFAKNVTANVTVLGDVKTPDRVPLTPRGERVLDAIAAAGGTTQPLDRMTIQITRGDNVQQMAARDILLEPRENIILKSDDVITALYQPYSFTVIGATGKNDEVHFEAVGLTLAQALGRVGGLQDQRADARGVFVFRWEPNPSLDSGTPALQSKVGGRSPVIYQADLKLPSTYFALQHFQIRDGDVIYVADSSLASLQKFLGLLSSTILPVATARTVLP